MTNLNDKKICILGFGKEGKSTYEYLKNNTNSSITIMDDNYENIDNAIPIDYNSLNNYDLIFKTPGISLKDIDISSFKDKITSQLEYLLENSKGYKIGITGTKGKSTTSSLIYEILKDQNKKTYLIGNIGNPIFDILNEIDDNTYLVIEMSSHQLEYIKYSPDISIILNLYPEHLDHYKDVDHYYKAKLNITKYQNNNDYLLYFKDNEVLDSYINNMDIKANIYPISIDNNFKDNYIVINNNKIFDTRKKIKLKGKHNLINITFALTISNILNLDMNKTINTISNFKGLPHRLEEVGKYNDIIFYNDSIATIPSATINAIETLKDVNTLIIGGMDRGIPYDEFINYLNNSNIENIICLPDTGYKIYDSINNKNTIKVKDVEKAVNIAMQITKKNTICLLSPAASSYGFYHNFEERGNRYKEAIKNYK